MLPADKNPGDPIEPHEYWVGKILEIRADAGNSDSEEIWVKVRWFYSAQDVAQLFKSFDPSTIGKFERLISDHWDFVLPQAFNEIIPMHRLRTFQQPKKPRGQLKGKAKTPVDSESDDTGDEGPESQKPIGPQMFYWRYEVQLEKHQINPRPGSRICLCSTPYLPDDPSALTGVMHFCPRPSCQTAYHVQCLRDAKSKWVDSEVIVPQRPKKRKLQGKKGGRGSTNKKRNGGKDSGSEVMDKGPLADNDTASTFLTERAIRLLCSSPDTNDDVDLLALIRRGGGGGEETLNLLQRIYCHHLLSSTQIKDETSTTRPRVISETTPGGVKLSAGSLAEVEDLLVEATVHVNGKHTPKFASRLARSRATQMKGSPHLPSFSQPISPRMVLSTLFLYPFNPSTVPPPATVPEPHNHPSKPSSLDHTPDPERPCTPTSNQEPSSSHTHTYPLLLTLASQPLVRWGGDDDNDNARAFHLGPTGNINITLRARRIVWDVLKAVGELDISADFSQMEVLVNGGDGGSGGGGRGSNEAEAKDERDFRKIRACVDAALKDWKTKVLAAGLPEKGGLELEDAIFTGGDLCLNPLGAGLSGQVKAGNDDGTCGGDPIDGEEAEDETKREKEEEHEAEEQSGRKRKRAGKRKPLKIKLKLKVEEDVSKVDWACPGCGGSI